MARNDDKRSIRCSFCGKPQSLVDRMIAGNNCYICDDCIRMCASIIGEETAQPKVTGYDGLPLAFEKLPKPMQIKARLDEYVIGQEKEKKYLYDNSLHWDAYQGTILLFGFSNVQILFFYKILLI